MAKGFSERNTDKSKKGRRIELEKQIDELVRIGHHEKAEDLLDNLSAVDTSTLTADYVLLKKADLCILSQNWDLAIQNYRKYYSNKEASKTLSFRKNLFHQAAASGANFQTIESLKHHCQFLSIEPNHAYAIRNFALVLRRAGALKDAEHYANLHLRLEPNSSEGYVTLGTILADQGKWEETIKCLRKAIEINPNNSNAMINLAGIYHVARDLDNAYIMSSKACMIDATNGFVWLDALTAIKRVCAFDRLNRIEWWKLINNLPAENTSTSMLQYLTMTTTEDDIYRFKSCAQAWGKKQSEMYTIKGDFSKINYSRYADRAHKIKVGIISADFKDHSVARFILPLFKNSGKANIELYAYSTQDVNDEYTKKFRSYAKIFRSIADANATTLAEIVRSDEIDALFDITGFTNGGRMAMLAQRLAPIQVSWLGFPGSIGLPEIDYLLLDKYLSPSSKDYINEKSLCMDGSSICFSDMKTVQITPKLPEETRGQITFGSLNNPYKFTQKNLECWAKVMQKTPDSNLLLVRAEYRSYYLRKHIKNEFKTHGITPDRIFFLDNFAKKRNYLDCYNEIDISLDTFPLTGGTTTIDALWMGVPVITIEGGNIHQRISSSILHQIGENDFIAHNEREFVEKAVSIANNRTKRKELRESLRNKILHSNLNDGEAFAINFRKAISKALAQKNKKSIHI